MGTDTDRPPGVSDGAVRLGAVVPLGGPAAATGAAIVAGLRAGFAEANARGGVHGRRIELQVQDARAGVRQALAAWQGEPVYALVGGLWSEAQEGADALLAQAHLPHIATLVVREQPPRAADWSADLLAPVALQRDALVQALAACPAGARRATRFLRLGMGRWPVRGSGQTGHLYHPSSDPFCRSNEALAAPAPFGLVPRRGRRSPAGRWPRTGRPLRPLRRAVLGLGQVQAKPLGRGLPSLVVGVWRGEADTVFSKAIRLCIVPEKAPLLLL